jgi:hypothetical protein
MRALLNNFARVYAIYASHFAADRLKRSRSPSMFAEDAVASLAYYFFASPCCTHTYARKDEYTLVCATRYKIAFARRARERIFIKCVVWLLFEIKRNGNCTTGCMCIYAWLYLHGEQVENYFSLWCTRVDSIKLKKKAFEQQRVRRARQAFAYMRESG